MDKEMTKERLAAYRSNRQEILELTYTLENRWKSETMIGNDVIFDYSKGYPMPQSIVGFDHEKYERLQDRDLHRKERLEKENAEIDEFIGEIEDSITRRIFMMYFTDGSSPVKQKDVAKKVHIDRSVISRKIDQYLLKVAHKTHETHL